MPMRSRSFPAYSLQCLGVVLGIAACEHPTPVAPTSVAPTSVGPAASAAPANPGHSFVFRSVGDIDFLISVDEGQDLIVRHYDAANIDFCGGSASVPAAEHQLVLTPGAAVYTWKTGFIPVYIYRLSEVPPTDVVTPAFCDDLKTKWIYRGMHQLLNHDNNLFGDPTRTNAFGWNAEGTVFDPAGGRHAYRESFLTVWDPETQRFIRESYVLSIR
jgi:hypothetical protein